MSGTGYNENDGRAAYAPFALAARTNHTALEAGLDEGILSFSLSNPLYMENPYS